MLPLVLIFSILLLLSLAQQPTLYTLNSAMESN
jgi:hypothetical protein